MTERHVEIDHAADTITICGIRYAFSLFEHMAFGRLHQPFELTDRGDGVVTVRMLAAHSPEDITRKLGL